MLFLNLLWTFVFQDKPFSIQEKNNWVDVLLIYFPGPSQAAMWTVAHQLKVRGLEAIDVLHLSRCPRGRPAIRAVGKL